MNKLEKILGINFPKGLKISNVTNSTDKVVDGSIFFGLKGTFNHGSKYINKALKLGASIIVHNDPNFLSNKSNIFFIKDLEKNEQNNSRDKVYNFLTEFYDLNDLQNENNFFTFTGTNGKTSSAYLCHQILANAGYNSMYIGTLGAQYKDKEINNAISFKTTPDIFELFEIFNHFKINEPISVCIEISSHALDQNRLKNIAFINSASILNIGSDHLDYHKDIQSYRNAKFKIFKNTCPLKLIHEDLAKDIDKYPHVKNSRYNTTVVSNKTNSSDIYYEIVESSINNTIFKILINNPPIGYQPSSRKEYLFETTIFPEFNISNLVFAICSVGFSIFSETKRNDLSFLKLPKGRSDFISDIPANVIIDYAHNAEGFIFFLSSIKNYFDNLIIVFGCGGDRDKKKRPKMLKAAIENGKKVIFTSDNSRFESFQKIYLDAINNNIENKVIAIEDRKEAIIQGSLMLEKNDCLVVLGKGHEDTQEINGRKVHFSDHEVIDEIYK
jgi:UDP-N-acetylmuramyl-tripeptide synthetase